MTDFERYVIARWAYSVGQPIMKDEEYNILHSLMTKTVPNSPYVKQSWSSDPCPIALLNKYGYKHLIMAVVLSDKTESIPSINNLVEIQAGYVYMKAPHVLSMKLDGWNIQASYYDGHLIHIQTRGRTMDAMDANALRPLFPKSIPIKGKVLITAEVVIPDADFNWFKLHYGATSQRGSVSTALAHPKECLEHVAVIAHGIRCSEHVDYLKKFELLESFGFTVPYYKVVYDYRQLTTAMDSFSDHKLRYGFPTDGLVIEGPDKVRALRVKAWEEPIYRSYVTGYEENYGPHSISVQIKIFPIKLPNSTQRTLPCTNVARVIALGLTPGAPVAFRVASSAIADIDEDSTILIQKEWLNRIEEYRFMVETNEALR